MLFWEPVDLYILKLPGVEMDEGIAGTEAALDMLPVLERTKVKVYINSYKKKIYINSYKKKVHINSYSLNEIEYTWNVIYSKYMLKNRHKNKCIVFHIP